MSEATLSALVQLLISLGGAGLIVQLLLLRQNRRRIAGEATATEANAASTLSGAAMKMVENAQLKEREAEARVDLVEARLAQRTREFEARRSRDAGELESRAWRIHHLEMRVAILENALRQTGVQIPSEPDYDRPRDLRPPPPDPGPSPVARAGEDDVTI